MRYSQVHIEAIGYELPPVVVSTADLEARLQPVYEALQLQPGQLELLTGINERRWWEPGYPLSEGAAAAARKALAAAELDPAQVDVLIYAGVCREQFEPATACAVAARLGIGGHALIYDLSNACLGVLNGVLDIANRIELGQARAGLVVSAETAREINENIIDQIIRTRSLELFRASIATLTGGSGAVAVLVVSEELSRHKRRKVLGGVAQAAPEYHALCRWGMRSLLPATVHTVEKLFGTQAGVLLQRGLDFGLKHVMVPFMETQAGELLKYGIEVGLRTWKRFLSTFGWAVEEIDKVICHQVGAVHRETMLRAFGIPPEKDFSTYPYLGNIGTVSLPLTAALAEEREFLRPGDRVGWLGIGSGLNCLMLGLEW
ncbi:MAG: 3-oxoacyl-ACP synthase III [Gemmataceae bacterium]|jgi:3-oxoacyl-[acyl-carrier-protein] synthase-3|uniref:3-oxoacyl-ACP synthase III n=1 Tax=Thermogemmata fonticola TaxID=2755323 RepID=A0A7V9ACK9_9BACT|nr:3-oxoacyl-ACP synthase III [Thermogemmata fonticola]MBA2227406.1 3-oxoacyl-ACP synthase III [Thermogemmata fonticola]MCX8140453.1 3-oxoacyl-ACP synthase III [Gemmataceae bacterium]